MLYGGCDGIVSSQSHSLNTMLFMRIFISPRAVTLLQTPMRVTPWPAFIAEHKQRNITFVGVDADDYQLDYLNRKLVNGLVGQLPFEIGSTCFQALYNHTIWKQEHKEGTAFIFPDRIRTNLVSYGIIPIELPQLDVEENLLGSLAWMGYIFFSVIALMALYCIGWTLRYRQVDAIVRAAQPVFLVMIAVGVLILASSMIPLSFDDGGQGSQSLEEGYVSNLQSEKSDTFNVGVCMSVPWLAFTGFTIIFSALFSKTWRVNKIVKSAMLQSSSGNANGEQRANITSEKDVLLPFAFLLSCNWAILLSWTLWDPLTYSRLEREGTDYWNRVIETYGGCHSENAIAFLIPLGVVNFAGVIMSCWQAFQARNITSEFSESKYIAFTVVLLCQGFLTGVPVIVVVRESPEAFYVVVCITTFLLSAAVLGLIFGPKIWLQRNYRGKSPAEQSLILKQAVLKNSDSSGQSGSGSGLGGTPNPVDNCSAWSSDMAYRSDHRRFNEPTVSSIPEDRAVLEENSDDEFERDIRFQSSLVGEDFNISKTIDEPASPQTAIITSTENASDSDSQPNTGDHQADDAM
jgi:hypothetical protein